MKKDLIKYKEDFYEYIDQTKKTCATRMKSKPHDAQIEKFIDSMWLDGYSKDTIVYAVTYEYGVNVGYAETAINVYVGAK